VGAKRNPSRDWTAFRNWGLIGAAAVLVVAGLVWILRSTPSSGGSPLGSGTEAPSIAEPATTGQVLSLQQLRGSKVVVYFYEGAG